MPSSNINYDIKIFTSTQEERYVDQRDSNTEDWLFLMLLARTGRRLGEILEITPRDINFDEKILWTKIEKTRRSGSRGMCVVDNKTAAATVFAW
jgi:integrase